MDNETLFFVFGIAVAVSAVTVSLIGLRSEKFPGKALPLVILWFAVLVGGATTFAVLHAQEEDKAKASEFAAENERITKEESSPEPAETTPAETAPAKAPAKGPGGTLQLSADPTQIAFDKTKLSSKPGKVTIDFDNPSAIQHDVVIEQNGKEIAGTPLIAEGKTSVTADLAPGTYTFLCTVPGHAEAGMEGTLTVR
jgi:plastocyanin